MKKMLTGICLLFIVLSLTSCAVSTAGDDSWQAAYLALIMQRVEEEQSEYDTQETTTAVPAVESSTMLSYVLLDFNQDGTPELLIAPALSEVYTYLNQEVTMVRIPVPSGLGTSASPWPEPFRNLNTNKVHWVYDMGASDMGSSTQEGFTELVFDQNTHQFVCFERIFRTWSYVSFDEAGNEVYYNERFYLNGKNTSKIKYEQAWQEWSKTYQKEGDPMGYAWHTAESKDEIMAVLAAWQ